MINYNTCLDCPHLFTNAVGDEWEWICTNTKQAFIQIPTETMAKAPDTPDWCPHNKYIVRPEDPYGDVFSIFIERDE